MPYHSPAVVDKLNEVRDEDPSNRTTNRVDTMLADVFSLLSLFFLRIGKGREAPATYSQIASIWVCRLFLPQLFEFFCFVFGLDNNELGCGLDHFPLSTF